MKAVVIETDLGRERRCAKCEDYWPDDREFFRYQANKCNACFLEWYAGWRKAHPPSDEQIERRREYAREHMRAKRAVAVIETPAVESTTAAHELEEEPAHSISRRR